MEKNRSKLLTTLVLLLVLALFYVFVFTPLRDENKDMKARLNDLSSELVSIEEVVDVKDNDVNIGEVDAKTLELAIPSGFDQDQVIENISFLANKYALEVSSISFGKTQTDNNYIDSNSLSLSITGGYNNFLQFLRELEASDRFYNVQNFTLGISDSEPREVNFSVNLELYNS